jgi:hypothetical protein
MIQVTDEDMFNMQLSVADRFGFGLTEIEGMSFKKLCKWYDGAVKLHEHEKG